jgi:hypothetical protein
VVVVVGVLAVEVVVAAGGRCLFAVVFVRVPAPQPTSASVAMQTAALLRIPAMMQENVKPPVRNR